ncbi:MAG: RagB/SusD family nutrient uptake outer membrane protein [Prolixibacteraceae bacterium]|nr:RagB/SusD family nutrient uptake outer membrane protein [Prolixibacteraceae bacterium]
MKQIKYIIVSIILLTTFGCEKFFEYEPVSLFSNENIFANPDYTEQTILGIYQLMTRDEGYSKRVSMYYGVDTDIAKCSGELDNGRRGIAKYAANSGNSEIEQPWRNYYIAIERANICIANIPESEVYITGTEEDKIRMDYYYGEAIALRALFYFELIRNWGDVPFKTVPSKAGDDFNLPKTDRDTIYEHLIADLKMAAELVPWRSELEPGERFNKGAVKGLLARIALARGGYSLRVNGGMQRGSDHLKYYEIARDACREVIESGEHQLNPSYENIFRTMCERKVDTEYGEVMLEIGMGQYTSSELGYYIGTRIHEDSKYGKCNPGVNALPNYYYSFREGDVRRDVTIVPYEIDENNANLLRQMADMVIAKWRREWIVPEQPGTDKFTGINWPILRYTDVLMMYAEAENELNNGPTPAAIDAMRPILERAYAKSPDKIPAIPAGKEAFFNFLVNERAWEFGGEALRKPDLIRWNLLDNKINEMRAQLTKIMLGETPYENIPRKIVWRQKGTQIEYLNLDYVMDSVQIAERDSLVWPNVTDWADDLTEEYILDIAAFFEPNRKELLPIHQSVIDTNPNLKNDFGY